MPQIKNTVAEVRLTSEQGASAARGDDPSTPPRAELASRLSSLVAARARVLHDLLEIDRKLADLRREAAGVSPEDEAVFHDARGLATFHLRGQEIMGRGFAAPPGIDTNDLERCLERVLRAVRRHGEPASELELRIDYRRDSGRVVSIATCQGSDRGARRQLYRRFLPPPGPGETSR